MIRFPVRSINQAVLYSSKLYKIYPKLAAFFSANTETHNANLNNNKKKQHIQYYIPIRPLKKQLTTLFGDKQYLNKGKIPKIFNVLPYYLPMFAVLGHNFLIGWTLLNSMGILGGFLLGRFLSEAPLLRASRKVLKLQISKDMSYYFLTVAGSGKTIHMKQRYPQMFLDEYQDYGNIKPQDLKDYQPSQEQKATLTSQQIQQKKRKHVQNNIRNIVQLNYKSLKISRFKIKKEDIEFGLSNNILGDIDQFPTESLKSSQITKKQLLSNICKYLIIKTNCYCDRQKSQLAYFAINLQENGQMKYQDYLIALGRNYQIKQQ